MSGELQSIPARHGTATFVPKGQTIRIINTYGRQVVDTWIFALPKPPEKEEVEEEEEAEEEEMKKVQGDADEADSKAEKASKSEEAAEKVSEDHGKLDADEKEKKVEGEKAEGEKVEGEKVEGEKDESEKVEKVEGEKEDTKDDEKPDDSTQASSSKKSSWTSYIPSIRSRGKAAAKSKAADEKATTDTGESRTWSSYFPSGKGFTSYLPTAKSSLSAFANSHARDPTKSYAEQLLDFSKTPVGAATLSVATGSNLSSSLYAAYSAYTKLPHPGRDANIPPTEYFSAPHTRAASARLLLQAGDTLFSNLRTPLATLIADTTARAAHDALTPACDAYFYAAMGDVPKPEEHGSCAENLVLALQELNEKAGLRGRRAVGADVSVNIAPAPVHLFMNAVVGEEGGIKVEEPLGPKRSFVAFRAERDVVFVMSACPNEKGVMNGGKCMAANFVVDEVWEGEEEETAKRPPPPKLQRSHGRKDSAAAEDVSKDAQKVEKRKPRKLERRSSSAVP